MIRQRKERDKQEKLWEEQKASRSNEYETEHN